MIISGGLEGGKKKTNQPTLARSKVQTDVYLPHCAISVLVLSSGRADFIVSAEIPGTKGVALAFMPEPRRKDTRLQLLPFFPVFTPFAPSPLLLSSHPDARKYTLQVIPVLTGLRSPMNNTDPISSIHYWRLTVHLADTSGVYVYNFSDLNGCMTQRWCRRRRRRRSCGR